MVRWNLNHREFARNLSEAGEGTGFTYETVVIPTTPSDLDRLIVQARASYRALRSRITGEPLAMTDSDTVPTPLDSLGKYGPRISNIISREHKVISSVRSLTDAGMYTDDRIFVLAYAMSEVIRINSEMDEMITSIIGHEHAEGFGSDISRMDADIRSQMSNIENIMATA